MALNKPSSSTTAVTDTRKRHLRDLRISVTDRCNFRCTYCMPKSVYDRDFKFLERTQLLSFDEINRLVGIFKDHGVEKVRITGGEPLLRKQLEKLLEMISASHKLDLTLTTNATLLKQKASTLLDAGLNRITVSLDSLDDQTFQVMNDMKVPVSKVLEGIEEADRVGFKPIKINMVVKQGVNDQHVVEMAKYFKGTGHIVRFIEFMDVGSTNGWQMSHVVPSKQLVSQINEVFPIEPVEPNYIGEVAERWKYLDGSGEIGFISSVTQAFCASCTRARLSAEGSIYTCLFATEGTDLRMLVRTGASDETISKVIENLWQARADNYSEIRTAETASLRKIEMSYIGG
ncbi:MAG: GTP 3',8-cyclase MoaA [Proteobacteria bacterium]|nr:GTP 3',8-cyclase MoaA [Pseudomonadota bacterium]MDA0861842.1 GTP 3',8-cyclase MoaA [Pseudomonadota bacterium]MDA1029948.1 GTP 3',8-cyclase MoaA [Pseudomonadota bacterium]